MWTPHQALTGKTLWCLKRAVARPQRFIGMHFFNPVPVMPFFEIVSLPGTRLRNTKAFVALRRTPWKTIGDSFRLAGLCCQLPSHPYD
ncbi:hypothetical protein E2553_44460 [Paraburkholderia dipogonis]|uniref:3-hydroxyacyl-CoA dehydrogenase NAD binding domain-containing protein n=1 Tax=Paraburkholderia dipogonis TaxID=1211383 RepID=A0A4Y8MGZ0_9BURK|nr:hypothetical protein E2553_44460 [Paraburkholderia dipogonis]